MYHIVSIMMCFLVLLPCAMTIIHIKDVLRCSKHPVYDKAKANNLATKIVHCTKCSSSSNRSDKLTPSEMVCQVLQIK